MLALVHAVIAFVLAFAATSAVGADTDVLNYALTLEHLEYAFYRDGLKQLNKKSSWGKTKIYKDLVLIRDHEKAHVDALNATITQLGGTPVKECEKYDFGFRNAKEFLAIARILENVGTSAYIGSAYRITSNALLTTAAAIATVEARHAAYLNGVNSVSPFPTAFDSPLDQQSVIGLASQFVKNCSSLPPITPHPKLTVPVLAAQNGKNLTVSFTATSTNGTKWCVFYAGSLSASSQLQWKNATNNSTSYWCPVPQTALAGDNFLFLSAAAKYDVEKPSDIFAGPALVQVRNATKPNKGKGGGHHGRDHDEDDD